VATFRSSPVSLKVLVKSKNLDLVLDFYLDLLMIEWPDITNRRKLPTANATLRR
jgi:hypothetical protein